MQFKPQETGIIRQRTIHCQETILPFRKSLGLSQRWLIRIVLTIHIHLQLDRILPYLTKALFRTRPEGSTLHYTI